MSAKAGTSSILSLDFDSSKWRDIEVPGEIIEKEWNDDILGKLRTRVETPSISRDEVLVAWKQVEDEVDNEKPPQARKKILEQVEGEDDEALKCLFAAYLFTRDVPEKFISHFYSEIENDVESEYEELYNDLDKEKRRVGKALLLYLYDYPSLKSIFALNHIDYRKPREIGETGTSPSKPIEDLDVKKLRQTLEPKSRSTKKWHDFEYNGSHYLVIKRHFRDDVDAQVTDNEEVEQAEYVVTRFYNERVDIHTEKKSTANTVRNGLSGSYDADQDIEFDRAEEQKPRNHFEDQTILSLVNEIEGLSGYTVRGVSLKNTPLTNSPALKIRDEEESVTAALEELNGHNKSFFKEMREVSQIVVDREGTAFTLYPNRNEDDDYEWYIRYHASGVENSVRDEFEGDMEEVFDLRPTFITSD